MNRSSKFLAGIFFFALFMINSSVIGRTRVYLNNKTDWEFQQEKLTRVRVKNRDRDEKVFLRKKIKIKPHSKKKLFSCCGLFSKAFDWEQMDTVISPGAKHDLKIRLFFNTSYPGERRFLQIGSRGTSRNMKNSIWKSKHGMVWVSAKIGSKNIVITFDTKRQ